jgi:hypothetical protein
MEHFREINVNHRFLRVRCFAFLLRAFAAALDAFVADSLPICYRTGADGVLLSLFAQRAFAALLAICFRSSAVSFFARALEPFLPMAAKYSLNPGIRFLMLGSLCLTAEHGQACCAGRLWKTQRAAPGGQDRTQP